MSRHLFTSMLGGDNWIDTNSFEFDGISEFFDIPNDSSMNITTNLTLSAWCKPILQDPPVDGWVLDKYTTTNRGYGLLHDDFGTGPGGGRWNFQLGDGSANRCRTTGPPTANQWQLVVGTYDSISGDAKIYIDGALNNTLNLGANTPLLTNSIDFNIGSGSPTPNNCFEGWLDEISVWAVTMDLSEVQELWGTDGPTDLTLHSLYPSGAGILWYRMGEESVWNGSAWVMPNAFIGSNDATSHSMLESNLSTDVP